MPPIFKALITISVWVLFIIGCFATITTGIAMGTGTPDKMSMAAVVNGIGGIVAFILACVAAWLRKKLE
jgi:uncharacterized membrane protein